MALAVAYQNTPGKSVHSNMGMKAITMEVTATIRAPNPAFRNTSVSRTAADANSMINRG